LNGAGLDICLLDPPTPSSPFLALFDRVEPELESFLHKVSLGGRRRVLAVALPASRLSDEEAWRLLRTGIGDVFVWDRSANPPLDIVAKFERWEAVDQLIESPAVRAALVGQGPAWLSLLRNVVEVARFTDASILIMGESGTGKELLARIIHALDPRPTKREMVVLDCTTIVPELSGSEFFGHDRGAFTGAVGERDGAFALADRGTLFLDEVGDLPLALQAQLLRAIQEHTYKRVGANTWRHTDFRLVCATNKDLLTEVANGRFRADLYYRIASFVCRTPPLRERKEDILLLVKHFNRELQRTGEPLELDEPVRRYLIQREYPGNVRDLKQLVSRILYRHVGTGPITIGDIPESERPLSDLAPADWRDQALRRSIRQALGQGLRLKEIGRAAEEIAEQLALEEEGGSLHLAAIRLGVTDRALQLRRAARRESTSQSG
jgi:transcriptional regulator with GAF, ATPase, and Fis domain